MFSRWPHLRTHPIKQKQRLRPKREKIRCPFHPRAGWPGSYGPRGLLDKRMSDKVRHSKQRASMRQMPGRLGQNKANALSQGAAGFLSAPSPRKPDSCGQKIFMPLLAWQARPIRKIGGIHFCSHAKFDYGRFRQHSS